ncbi:serine/threonine-protein phosphatase 7 long form homolog [Amaranthus tricolor]|uniref:serine/threonine-protein phosphatase 7 long form homolog n=1 Tax=Amaranthus tricolor TaxID=29722 RepID=UPI00258597C2|nr:serine/threonine-protein phosphatase 7 long form homolog [Amaranthus tricolor]
MGGCLMLLQIWSWEHIHIGRPIIRTVRPDGQHDQEDDADDFEPILGSQHRRGMDPLALSWLRVYLSRSHSPHTLVYYRDALDRQRDEQMTWQPYTAAKMEALPHICTSGHEIWRSRCPLICFDIVELHLPDRVMRQFGLEQVIPQACDTQRQLHAIDRRTGDKNYLVRHRSHVDAWNDRASTLVGGDNFTGHSSAMYMSWYRRISILRLTNIAFAQPGSHYHPTSTLLAERIQSVLIQCNDTIQGAATSPVDVGYRLCSQTLGSINASLTDALSQAGYEYLIPTPPVIGDVDDTFHTPSPRSSAHRGSSSGGSSSRSTRGRQRSSTQGRSSRSPSTSATMSPFVPPSSINTPPPHPSPPQRIITYQRASQRRAPTLNVIAEVDEFTPSSSTGAQNKRGRGL